MLPIARWLQRRAIWLVGYNEDSIKTFLEDNNLADAAFEPVEFEVEGEIAPDAELPEDVDMDEIGDDESLVLGGDDDNLLAWV